MAELRSRKTGENVTQGVGLPVNISVKDHINTCCCRDKVHHLSLSTHDAINSNSLAPLTATLPVELRKKMENFIAACYQVRKLILSKLAGYSLGTVSIPMTC